MKPILMSPQNPDGHKLEELLSQVRLEVEGKCLKIAQDQRAIAQRVHGNNRRIIALLMEAESIQRESMAALDAFRPNEGPLGRPRIGEGSKA